MSSSNGWMHVSLTTPGRQEVVVRWKGEYNFGKSHYVDGVSTVVLS